MALVIIFSLASISSQLLVLRAHQIGKLIKCGNINEMCKNMIFCVTLDIDNDWVTMLVV
jgi:hypothetical protein